MQTKWEVKRGATVRFPDISSRFAKCCTYLDPHFDMVHLFHPTFPNGGYELQMKWEVNCGATFRFPDISSRFAKCCTHLDPHFDMVHFFHPTFANGGSYMFTLNASPGPNEVNVCVPFLLHRMPIIIFIQVRP